MFYESRESFVVGRMHLLLKLRPEVVGSVILLHLLVGVLLGLVSRWIDLNLFHLLHLLNRVGLCSQFHEHDRAHHDEQDHHWDGDS